MTMKNAPLLLLVSMAVSSVVYGQQSVPAGSTVFVDTNNGFDIFILAALQAKHVPLVLVSSRDKADYILDSALFHSSEFVATQKVAGTYRVSESAFKLTSKPTIILAPPLTQIATRSPCRTPLEIRRCATWFARRFNSA